MRTDLKLKMAVRMFLRRFRIRSASWNSEPPFELNENVLKVLACPLSKKPLRYDQSSNELICDEIGVAYPIKNGIPCLLPQEGRLINKENQQQTPNMDK
jgi:uncharacterized protein YbaR (Trm112 family)